MFPNLTPNAKALADKISAKARSDARFDHLLQLWFRGQTPDNHLRDVLAAPFAPCAGKLTGRAFVTAAFAHYAARTELDNALIPWRRTIRRV